MKLTEKEKDQIREQRRQAELAKKEAEFMERYDNCYCQDENGNWI